MPQKQVRSEVLDLLCGVVLDGLLELHIIDIRGAFVVQVVQSTRKLLCLFLQLVLDLLVVVSVKDLHDVILEPDLVNQLLFNVHDFDLDRTFAVLPQGVL